MLYPLILCTLLLALCVGCEKADKPPAESAPTSPAEVKAATPAKANSFQWQPLTDGTSLAGWKVPNEWDFKQHGEVSVVAGELILPAGKPATGLHWDGGGPGTFRGEFPRSNYELELEAKRTAGSDFFCGLTFPVGPNYLTLIVGGWGGGVLGLSNIDNLNASENETSRFLSFDENRWYKLRLRVTPANIAVWLDDEQVIDLATAGHEFTIWFEQQPLRPLGIATWHTAAVLRNLRVRLLDVGQTTTSTVPTF